MYDTNFNKNLTAAEYDAILILQSHIPGFKKIDGEQLRMFYKGFEDFYDMGKKSIDPLGQKVHVMGNHLLDSVSYSRWFMQNYANTRISYETSVHFLGASFGRLLGGVQFGFKSTNPDIAKYKKELLENAVEIARILKTINPNLKLKDIPKRILEIYHENQSEVHFFAVQFAQELSR